MNYCYIKLRKFPVVEFVNFTEIKDFAYISISRVSKTLTIYTKEMTETDYRFRIDFPKTGWIHGLSFQIISFGQSL